MIILPNRIKFIEKHFFEFSFNSESEEEVIPDFEIFKKLSSAEQYYLASIYNWDDGATVLNWIIDSPKCDRGTATMIFWMADPEYYSDFTKSTVGEYDKDIFYLLQKILKKIKNKEFNRSWFCYNPKKNRYETDWAISLDIWELPSMLKKGTLGIKPIAIGK